MEELTQYSNIDLVSLLTIIESTEDAVITKQLDGTITSWNPAAERIFGYSEKEAIGKNISLIIPEKLKNEEKAILKKIKRGEKIGRYTTERVHKNGNIIPVRLSISSIRDEDGTIVSASEIARTISDNIQSEEKQALLVSIISSSSDAIISKDINGYITSWNIGAQKLFGYSEEEIIGKPINTIIPLGKREEEALIIKRIRNGERLDHFETTRLTKNGELIDVSITVSPIFNSKGEIVGASKIARNISDRIELEKQLKQNNEKLKELNNSKDEFIGMASHELKTPLTSITAFLQLLERNLTDPLNRNLVNKAIRHVRKLSSLVSDLLDVSKIEAGKLQLNPTSFILSDLVNETVETVQTTITTHKIVCKYTQDSSILADKERIGQVIINLLTNAVKYSPDATEVLVETLKTDDNIIVRVTDYGIGISRNQMEHIFSRFYRAEGLSPTFPGLGIGLYISHEIIERHNGKMWVESEEGKGSTFSFRLPIQSPELELW